MEMYEELIEEYIETFDSLTADEYFDQMKARIEQDDGVAMFLLAVKYEIEGRHSEAEILYAKSDVSRDEAWALDDFIAQNVSIDLDHEALNSKLFTALITSPSKVENLWEFQLPEAPKLGLYCYHDDYDCGCGRDDRAERVSKDVWGKPRFAYYDSPEEQEEASNWIYKWYYPMACQQGMPEISYESAVDRYMSSVREDASSYTHYFKHNPHTWGCGCHNQTREEYGVINTDEGDICRHCRRIIRDSVEIVDDRIMRSKNSSPVTGELLPTAEEAIMRIGRQDVDINDTSHSLVELIDEYLTNLFIEKGGAHYCKVTKGIYELDRGLTEEAVEASKRQGESK